MKRLLTGSLILMAAVALLATGCERVAQAPAGKTGDSPSELYSYRQDVAEVVVTAQRPGWLMTEVVASASQMPEVVVHASRSTTPAALSALPSAVFVN